MNMFEITYTVGDGTIPRRSVVVAANEVLARGLIRLHENHQTITVITSAVIPENVVYMVY